MWFSPKGTNILRFVENLENVSLERIAVDAVQGLSISFFGFLYVRLKTLGMKNEMGIEWYVLDTIISSRITWKKETKIVCLSLAILKIVS